ncbi:class III signal peptide-containing protein [Thermococcus sp.]
MRRAQGALEYLFMMAIALMVIIILYRVHPQSTSGNAEQLGEAISNVTSNLTDQVKNEYSNL